MPDDVLLRFAHITDTHINPDTTYNKNYARYSPLLGAQALVQHLKALPFTLDCVLHTGDVIFDPEPEAYFTAQSLFNQLDLPVYYVAGNHDHQEGLQNILMGRDTLQTNLHYQTDINGVQLIVVDSNGPAEPPAGHIPEAQLAWLERLCSAPDERPLVVAIHHQPYRCGVKWLDDWMRVTNGDEFHRIVQLAKHRLRGVFHGHIHQPVDVWQDGVFYSSAASSWVQFHGYPIPDGDIKIEADTATPAGYSVVTITRNRTYIRRYSLEVNR